jgi:NTE family protein
MTAEARPRPFVTLVLGAGGPVGCAFHVGVLHALAEGGVWDARTADLIIGTSAGSQIGALLRAGWGPYRMLQHVTERAALAAMPPARGARRWPASMAYLRAVLDEPSLLRLGPLIAALLPEGRHEARHLGETVRRLFEGHWPHRPLWIPAVHVDTGARVVFGREDAPLIDVATAVRGSSAVPGLRRPVKIGAHRYVDGGVASPTHADLAAEAPRDRQRRVVVVLSPLSRFAPLRILLRRELRGVRARGIDVVLFEPDRTVVSAMGWNPMKQRAAPAVAEAAFRSTLARLRRPEVTEALHLLVG